MSSGMGAPPSEVAELVTGAARAAQAAAEAMADAADETVGAALAEIASRLSSEAGALLEANADDIEAAEGVLSPGLVDRLRLGEARLAGIAEQVTALAALPPLGRVAGVRTLANGLVVEERRVPVGVIGANYEARPNVTVDVATQLVKSRNAGVLRTGGASLRSATALVDRVIGPGLAAAGLPAGAVQLVRTADREAASVLVSLPQLIPLVILRGSGETTASLARQATEHGVRSLAHAEGGGVLYVHPGADPEMALGLIEGSLDRLGVCNRLNLLLVDEALWDAFVPQAVARMAPLGVTASLPPHDHPIGYEWANDPDRGATVTIAPVGGAVAAARLASAETSGLAAGIVTGDREAAAAFLNAYRGTAGFWNAITRWLDGFELTSAPETGINIDRVPGPRGPVTYRDLYLRQYVITGDGTQRR
ncbi:MAG TPA: aldehyde dehydrogenase family protein [Actinomycetota bacterium]|nr:aldehyde dehydrogenase family protein [Actinomycetota bacterium]